MSKSTPPTLPPRLQVLGDFIQELWKNTRDAVETTEHVAKVKTVYEKKVQALEASGVLAPEASKTQKAFKEELLKAAEAEVNSIAEETAAQNFYEKLTVIVEHNVAPKEDIIAVLSPPHQEGFKNYEKAVTRPKVVKPVVPRKKSPSYPASSSSPCGSSPYTPRSPC